MRRCCGEPQCTCVVQAGDGVTVSGNGSTSSPYTIGLVPVPLPEVGCGLTGDGSAGAPITVATAAGEQAWPWACDAAAESTLACDPNTGKLWTPPDHTAAADRVYIEHWAAGGPTLNANGGAWFIINPTAVAQFPVPANFLGNACRTWNMFALVTGSWDISYTANAVFEVGYAASQGGGPGVITPLWGRLVAPGTAGRERQNGVAVDTAFGRPANAPWTMAFYPAARVVAGSITINGWNSFGGLQTTTSTP